MVTPKRFVLAKLESADWSLHLANPDEAGFLTPDGDNYRFYPDADAPGGGYRPKVDVLAQVSPAVAGISVIMQWYDVDDPSDDDGPIDDDNALPNDVNNFDNLLFGHKLNYGGSDASGTVRGVWEWTTFHPGNNIRVVLGPNRPEEFAPIKALRDNASGWLFYDADGDGFFHPPELLLDHTNPRPNKPITRMLTLWRKLHVEVDSMGPVVGNFVGDTAADVVDNGDGTSTVTLGTGGLERDRFENGRLWDLLANEFVIVSNTANAVIVNNLPGRTIPEGGSGPVTLRDDDVLQDGQDVPMPDTSELDEALAEAFVSVAFDVGDNNDEVPFVLNSSSTSTDPEYFVNSFDWDSKPDNSNPYWVSYVLGGFQEGRSVDNDPDTENGVGGRTSLSNGGSIVYIETDRDYALEHGWNISQEQQDTVVHEVGHAVANSNTHPVTLLLVNGTFSRYTEEYLLRIRSSDKPAG